MTAHTGAMLDTSVWVALFEDAAEIDGLDKAQGDLETVTSPIVVSELESLSSRGRLPLGGPKPSEVVIDRSRMEDLTAEDAIAAGRLHGRLRRQGHEKVGLGDCLVYATAQRVGALLVTLDADLAGQRGVVVLGRRTKGEGRRRKVPPRRP